MEIIPSLIVNIIFFGTAAVFASLSVLASFIVIKYGKTPAVTITASCAYLGLFLFGFLIGLSNLS